MKKFFSIFLSILLCNTVIFILPVQYAFASGMSISAVSRLDLSKGAITGQNADYILVLPQLWQGYLIADREKLNGNSQILDKLTFYYQPYLKVTKPAFLMDLCVYDSGYYSEETEYRKIMETKKYIFFVRSASENQFIGVTDSALFNVFLKNIWDDSYLNGMIVLAADDEVIIEHSITVNGKVLDSAVIRDQSAAYLPVREVCEALGYAVTWLEKDKAVSIKNWEKYSLLTLKESSANMGFGVLMKDNRIYVSSIFFIQELKCSIEVDDRYNVSIYK